MPFIFKFFQSIIPYGIFIHLRVRCGKEELNSRTWPMLILTSFSLNPTHILYIYKMMRNSLYVFAFGSVETTTREKEIDKSWELAQTPLSFSYDVIRGSFQPPTYTPHTTAHTKLMVNTKCVQAKVLNSQLFLWYQFALLIERSDTFDKF